MLKREDVFKSGLEILTVKEYCEKYGNNVTPQSIQYAIEKGKIDGIKLGRDWWIVMTQKTQMYSPNASRRRAGASTTRSRMALEKKHEN